MPPLRPLPGPPSSPWLALRPNAGLAGLSAKSGIRVFFWEYLNMNWLLRFEIVFFIFLKSRPQILAFNAQVT